MYHTNLEIHLGIIKKNFVIDSCTGEREREIKGLGESGMLVVLG
jgi:hypothetical protein